MNVSRIPYFVHHQYARRESLPFPRIFNVSHVLDDPPIQYPAVVAYIVRNGLMLSVTRKDTGELSFPGGKCEANEYLHNALRREMREEVGLTPIHWHLVYDGKHSSGRRVYAYRILEWNGVPRAVEHGTRIAWVAPDVMANSFGADYHRRALAAAGFIRRAA
jgi:8-oxo-dGTP pyrophosphatase MutT (NUDIX family)